MWADRASNTPPDANARTLAATLTNTMRIISSLTILIFLICGCNQNTKEQDFSEMFYKKQGLFDTLVFDLQNKHLDTLIHLFNEENSLANISAIDSSVNSTIKQIGISRIISGKLWNCIGINEYDIQTTWNKQYPIHINYNKCDSIRTKKGYYKKDANSNEVWGLGNNWYMWKEILAGKL